MQEKPRKIVLMKYLQLESHVSKILAVVAASLILPGLTLAGTDNGKGNDGQNNGVINMARPTRGPYRFGGSRSKHRDRANSFRWGGPAIFLAPAFANEGSKERFSFVGGHLISDILTRPHSLYFARSA
jgi:hypothetical protein